MSRVHSNWVEAFLDWTMDRSESPKSFLYWSALFSISSILKRKVMVPREILGTYDIFPHLYIMFVGEAGVVRKTTTAGYAEELLRGYNKIAPPNDKVHFGPSSGSDVKLVETMANTGDGSMTIISGEFGNLVKTTPENMYDVLSHLFDARDEYTHSTRQHGDETIKEPILNFLGCTTPDWISEAGGYMIGGGFASRTLFVYETAARQRALYYTDVDHEEKERIGEGLIHDLRKIASLKGSFSHESQELMDKMEEEYKKSMAAPADASTVGFKNRKYIHIHKVMMLLSVAESDDLILRERHYKLAKKLVNDVERKTARALSAVGKNPHSRMMYQVLDYIDKSGPVTKKEILRRFYGDARTHDAIDEVLEALVIMDYVKKSSGGDNIMKYRAV